MRRKGFIRLISVSILVIVLVATGIFFLHGDTETVREEESNTPYSDEILTIKKVPGLSDDFIKGVDISSYLAETASGVKYYDTSGNEVNGENFIKVFADAGVNYIRLRVWNDPKTEDGKTYGGGNNDIETAIKICEYINAYNKSVSRNSAMPQIKVLLDLQYSDFWADPDKQAAPKAWEDMSLAEREEAVKAFTKDCIEKVSDSGVTVGMVQIGNETNNGICGYRTGSEGYTAIFRAGCDAVKEYNDTNGTSIKRVVHYTDPQKVGSSFAKLLEDGGVEYDVYATSYYPYWHGTTENLYSMLNDIAVNYKVEVMVAETQYVYTNKDYDGSDNQAYEGKDNIDLSGWSVSVQGQANEIRDVINAVAKVGDAGIGVFYWEPAWLGVGNAYNDDGTLDQTKLTANKEIWESYGSGWATDAAAEYDPSVAQWGGGGTNNENASLFDFTGHPLPSLNVFKYVDKGAVAEKLSYYNYESLDEVWVTVGTSKEKLIEKLPTEVCYYMSDLKKASEPAKIIWDDESISKAVSEIAKTSTIGHTITVTGKITVQDDSEQVVSCTINVDLAENKLINGDFDTELGEEWQITDKEIIWQSNENPRNGSANAITFNSYNISGKEIYTSSVFQTVTITEPGNYEARAFFEGADKAGSRDGELLQIIVKVGDQAYSSDKVVLADWMNWQCAIVSDIKITNSMIEAGNNKVTVCADVAIKQDTWGSIDDFYLYKVSDVEDDSQPE